MKKPNHTKDVARFDYENHCSTYALNLITDSSKTIFPANHPGYYCVVDGFKTFFHKEGFTILSFPNHPHPTSETRKVSFYIETNKAYIGNKKIYIERHFLVRPFPNAPRTWNTVSSSYFIDNIPEKEKLRLWDWLNGADNYQEEDLRHFQLNFPDYFNEEVIP